MGSDSMVVAAVQATPVFLDRERTVAKSVSLVAEAARNGARLIVFPEVFVPGYPDWVWRTTPWAGASGDLYARLLDQSVTVPGPAVSALSAAARQAAVFVAVGINERDPVGSTVYNSLLYLGPDGSVLGVHRKLMPTGGERLVWGSGDGSGLVTFDTPLGRVGGLICWENYMPLARAAMYAKGVDIYLAPTWDNSEVWVATLQHIAKEGRCYVIGTNSVLRGSDVPAAELGVSDLYGGEDDWMSRGNTCIVGPGGHVLAGPLSEEEGILYAEVDPAEVRRSRLQFDACGHYARDDVFQLLVDEQPRFTRG
jgi:nitrilase